MARDGASAAVVEQLSGSRPACIAAGDIRAPWCHRRSGDVDGGPSGAVGQGVPVASAALLLVGRGAATVCIVATRLGEQYVGDHQAGRRVVRRGVVSWLAIPRSAWPPSPELSARSQWPDCDHQPWPRRRHRSRPSHHARSYNWCLTGPGSARSARRRRRLSGHVHGRFAIPVAQLPAGSDEGFDAGGVEGDVSVVDEVGESGRQPTPISLPLRPGVLAIRIIAALE